MTIRTVSLAAALLACAIPPRTLAAGRRPDRWGPYALDLVDEAGRVLPTFRHAGRTYALGTLGQRYGVRVRNGSGRRIEAVISVDGRDAIDGRPSAWEKRGYLVEPGGEVTIDGYRLDQDSVAAFRFSSVPQSYASRMGDARDVGVIGLAIFPERSPREIPAPPMPYQPWRRDRARPEDELGRSAESQGSPAPSSAPADKLAQGSLRADRRGLGTEFGEERDSRVTQVPFERAGSRPQGVLSLRYDDRAGLLALGIDVDGRRWSRGDDSWLRESASPFRRDSYAEPPPGWSPGQ